MSNIHFYLTAFILLTIFSCKQKEKAEDLSAEMEISFPINVTKGGSYQSMPLLRSQAEALIETRIKESGDALSIVTAGFWNPEYIFNEKMSEPGDLDGYWMDFKEDFSYQYGLYGDFLGSGKYYFKLDDKSMVWLDDNEDYEPKIWKVLYNGRAMALQGSHDLGINNGMQVKLISIDAKPIKQ